MKIHALFFIFLMVSQAAASAEYTVFEGTGIDEIATIGGDLNDVHREWGKPERIVRSSGVMMHEYPQHGAVFMTDSANHVYAIRLYCHQKASNNALWSSPATRFQTFDGSTVKGFRFTDSASIESVYDVYGKPTLSVPRRRIAVLEQLAQDEPFIIEDGNEMTICYPALDITFSASRGVVESVTIGDLGA